MTKPPFPIGRRDVLRFLPLAACAAAVARATTADAASPAAADHVVFKNQRGLVCLRSGQNSRIVAKGREAAAIIQRAIDSLPVSGGTVFLAGGSYGIDSTIRIHNKHGVRIQGAARGMQGREKGGTVLWSDRAIDLLEIFGGDKRVFGVTVSDLLLYGSGKDNGKAGILVRGTTDAMTFQNVGANNCGIGFHFQGGRGTADSGVIDAAQVYFCDPQINGIGMLIERAHYTKIVGGEFSDCTREGIRLSSPGRDERIQGVKIVAVTAVRNGGAGIFIGRNCEDITVGGGTDVGGTRDGSGIVVAAEQAPGEPPSNIILSDLHSYNNDVDGITLDRARHVVVSGTICSVHDHASVRSAGQKAGIRIKAGCEHILVSGNATYGNQEKGVADETGRARLAGNSEQEAR